MHWAMVLEFPTWTHNKDNGLALNELTTTRFRLSAVREKLRVPLTPTTLVRDVLAGTLRLGRTLERKSVGQSSNESVSLTKECACE